MESTLKVCEFIKERTDKIEQKVDKSSIEFSNRLTAIETQIKSNKAYTTTFLTVMGVIIACISIVTNILW